ncbi:MAG: UDP-2,3-diacylglucosamine diphosphatase LpxI [Pseudomonadota bacterium]
MRALIAGAGRLPVYLAERAERLGEPVVIAEMRGFPSEVPDRFERLPFRIERLGDFFEALKERGVQEIVTAGAVRRPAFDPAALDRYTAAIAADYVTATQGGDDQLARMVLGLMVKEGFTPTPAHVAAPELLPPAGCPTRRQPEARDETDAVRALAILDALGPVDTSQAVVVAAGQALGIEALPGTDHLLAALAEAEGMPKGGLLLKAPKSGQDARIDWPVIGTRTVEGARAAGLNGIAVAHGGVMIIDPDAVVAAADDANLFLWIRE